MKPRRQNFTSLLKDSSSKTQERHPVQVLCLEAVQLTHIAAGYSLTGSLHSQ